MKIMWNTISFKELLEYYIEIIYFVCKSSKLARNMYLRRGRSCMFYICNSIG